MEVKSHKDLIVWQKAMELAVQIYHLTKLFPPREQYALTSQITRAAASVPANIAEGKARATAKDYAQFLSVARGSLMETETFLLLAIRLDYVSEIQAACAMELIAEVGRLINAIRSKLVGSNI